jgi:hypothetical protein
MLDSSSMLDRATLLLLVVSLLFSGCGGARLSHAEIRKQIASLGTSTLVPSSVSVRRIIGDSGNRTIAETTVELAFQFERDTETSPWHITAVRLGDQNWVSVPELLAALNESRRKIAAASLEKLGAGVMEYRQKNGALPSVSNIQALADVLHPQYMRELILDDPWGRPIEVESAGTLVRFRSLGPDGQRGTDDDILSQQ